MKRELTPAEIDASVDCTKAQAERARAAARNFLAQERETLAQARTAEAAAASAEMDLAVSAELHARHLAADAHHHVYRFAAKVASETVRHCIDELSYWHRMDEKCPMEVVFYSPGGEVMCGMALYDFLRDMSQRGHHITTVCSGYAASMAGIILQAGDKRIIGAESYLLIHEITAATYGKVGVIEDDVKFYKRICDRVVGIFVNRSGGKLTKARMNKEWRGHDWWIDSKLALQLGIVDEVR